MKVFGLTFLLLLSAPSWSQGISPLEEARAEHIKKLKEYQENNPGWDSAPSDEYVHYFKKWNDESLAITLKYHEARCEADKSDCLSKKQERDLRSQYKVASETVQRQNKLAKTSQGELVTTPGEFGGTRAPAEDEKLITPLPEAEKAPEPEKLPEVEKAPEAELAPEAEKVPGPQKAPEVEKVPEAELAPQTETKPEEEAKVEEELDKFNDEEFPKNYDPKTCEWVEDMPRKIVYGPSFCSRQAVQICTGYVVCERKQGGGKFVRMSSCSPKNCDRSKESAIACTLEQAYYSRRPEDERNHFVSPELKKMLTAPKVRAQ